MFFSKKCFFVVSLLLTYSILSLAKTPPETTAKISPTGPVETVEQIQVSFSSPMIKIGNQYGAPAPIESNCLLSGDGYWIDEKSWVYTFRAAPPTNTTCNISTIKDLKNLAGALVKPASAEFKTLQAQIVSVLPSTYNDIDPNQNFVLVLNGNADPKWIKENVYFTVQGLGEKIPAILVEGEKKKQIIAETKKHKISRYSYYDDYDGESNSASETEIASSNDFFAVLKADRVFPRGYKIELHWLQDYSFNVQKAFKAEFTCERETADSACVPLGNLTLNFTDMISAKEADKIYLMNPKGEKLYPVEKDKSHPSSSLNSISFKGPFLPRANYQIVIAKSFKSLENEKLTNADAFPLKFETADLPSLLKIDREFSVIEASNPVLPVTIRNIENPLPTTGIANGFPLTKASTVLNSSNISKVIELLKLAGSASRSEPISPSADFKKMDIKVLKSQANQNTEIVGIPLSNKGLHFTEFKSRILGQKLNYESSKYPDYYVRALSLVTNIGLTMKSSQHEVLIWATSLDKGEAVVDAPVFLYNIYGDKVRGGRTNEQGIAYFKLTAEEELKLHRTAVGYYGPFYKGFFAFVQKNDDFSFVHSQDTQGLERYRFGINLPSTDPDIIYHAILEKSLLRPNEKVKAKLIFRKLENFGLSIPKIDLPAKIQIKSRLSRKKYLVKVKWDITNGTGTFEWKIPEEANLGAYVISTPDKSQNDDDDSDESDYSGNSDVKNFGSFSVEEFKIPNISAQLTALNLPWINSKNHQVEFSARYFSGGPAALLPVKIKYSLASSYWSPDDEDYLDYNWQAGEVKEGLTKYQANENRNQQQPRENQIDGKLDQYGFLKIDLKDIKYANAPQSVVVSAEYSDANGDIQTMTRSYPLFISKYMIGVKSQSWYQTSKSFEYEAALLDLKSKPVANKIINISLYKVDNYSTRKKILGGFYSYENFVEVKRVKDLCTGKTNTEGKITCKGSDSNMSGEYIVAASYTDENGTSISTKQNTYLSGGDYWYGGTDSDRMDLIPTKKTYEPGETAEFQVRGPITEGNLLVTVERRGILTHFVQKYDSKNPTVKLKILENWAPNVVVTAVLLRGRVDAKVTGLLDLGKPALKMGMTNIRVGIKKHILKVTVTPNKEIFQPREMINVNIDVKDHDGKPINGEMAVAAIDEGLLALRGNSSWDLLNTMLPPRAHDVETSYIISQVLGKRTLGLKAVPAGGDGAGNAARELFDTSLFWNAKVLVKNGVAKISFPANDSLTSFKIVAIAQAGADKFGTGNTSIKITKDIQTYPALALAVRNNDAYFARFSVRNTTNLPVTLKATLLVNKSPQPVKEIILSSNKTSELSWPIIADDLTTEQNYELTLNRDGKILDSIKFKQPVQNVWAMRSFGSSFRQALEMKVPITQASGSTRAEVQITAIPSLASEMPGIKKFWDLYPFDCFEQRLSKAISLNSEKQFEDLMKIADLYLDSNGLVKFYPQSRFGDVFLTNYVLQITKHKNWKLNADFEDRTLEALRKFFDGTLNFTYYFDKKHLELVRLESLDSLVLFGKAKPSEFNNLKLSPLEMLGNNYLAHAISIFGHADATPSQTKLLEQSLQILRSRTVASSARLSLKDAVSEPMYGMYAYDDLAFAKLLIQVLKKSEFKDDAGKLILSFIDNQKSGSWYNTMSNAWGTVALQTYKEEYEKDPVIGNIKWGLKGEEKSTKIDNQLLKAVFNFKGDNEVYSKFEGQGKPWWSVLVSANAPVTQNLFHGIIIEKEWLPVSVKDKNSMVVGDIWEISLKIKSKAEFRWLAIRDPLPPGASVIMENGASLSEKKALEYRVFEDWFGDNEKIYKYQIRLNQAGQFNLPTTRAEAMYDTDIYGEKVNGSFNIKE